MDFKRRLEEIKDLNLYLNEKDKLLSNILTNLSWSEENLFNETKIQCPNDAGHWIQESTLSKHLEICSWVKDGYPKEELAKQLPSSKFFYQQSSSVVSLTIDKETQANILLEKGLIERKPLDEMPDVPQTIDRWSQELTTEQRLAIYDYVVKEFKSNKHNVSVEDLMFDFESKTNQDNRPKTELEILAEQRDYKRRRQSYRAKNVHITKKSYTEVMKEVIENQITFLAETRKQENNERLEDPSDEEMIQRSSEERYLSREHEHSYDFKHHHKRSRSEHSRSPVKRRKHKRSRSRSGSRKQHKKSHHKHKKSRD